LILSIIAVTLDYQDPLGKRPFDNGVFVDVLWIALHRSFKKSTRENNIAIVGTAYPFQFHAHLYPICLPSGVFSDSNAGNLRSCKK
jgi:hypothetical protein